LIATCFGEDEYLPAFVTDRPDPTLEIQPLRELTGVTLSLNPSIQTGASVAAQQEISTNPDPPRTDEPALNIEQLADSSYDVSSTLDFPVASTSINNSFCHKTPEQIKPFPKAPPRKTTRVGKNSKLVLSLIHPRNSKYNRSLLLALQGRDRQTRKLKL